MAVPVAKDGHSGGGVWSVGRYTAKGGLSAPGSGLLETSPDVARSEEPPHPHPGTPPRNTGKEMVNTVPTPSSLSTSRRPPSSATVSWQIHSPNPVPWALVV